MKTDNTVARPTTADALLTALENAPTLVLVAADDRSVAYRAVTNRYEVTGNGTLVASTMSPDAAADIYNGIQ